MEATRETSMKKLLKYFMVIVMAVISISCSDENDGGGGSNLIEGTWMCTNHYYRGSDYFTFKSNGTYSWRYSGEASHFAPENGRYTFSNNILTITNSAYITHIYVVLNLNSSSMTLVDEDGYHYTYWKQ